MAKRHVMAAAAVLAVALTGFRAARVQQPDGQALFNDNCRKCHGLSGRPTHMALTEYPHIPTMDSAFALARSEDSIVTILTNGKGKDMKSFKGKLSPAEMHAVAQYVRSLAMRPKS
ncbi:MAG TPA: c-type cytochrome [Gemmatimonadales bacterium]|nr:c-type cytochrome [Gemmatimonadales bacterium]